jgi:heme-degrading monooxygenase HmoA
MYAMVRTYSVAPGLAEQLVGHADEVKSLIGGIDGFQAYYLIRTDGGAVSVSVYDSQAGAEESARAAAGFLADVLGDLNVGAPEISAGEVVLQA